jgi:hypothetical protein
MSETATSLDALILRITSSINVRALYPPQHPRVVEAVGRVLESLAAVCAARRQDGITFLLVDADLVVDERPLRKVSIFQQHFVQTLRRLGIEGLTLSAGLGPEEYQSFLAAAAGGAPPGSSEHIVVGRVKVAVAEGEGSGEGAGGAVAVEPLSAAQLDSAREGFARFRSDRQGKLDQMDKVVWSLMDAMARSTRKMLPIAPLKEHDEYTFVHSVNVSLLVLAQARSFGIQGPMLHALGLAALLHDIGKLHVPLSVLNKPGRLEAAEWPLMMGHTELGARHLAGLEGAGPLSILVAYEHHLRYDGKPNYPLLTVPRPPSLASQMTALADTYDAMCTVRPYKKAKPREVALGVLAERAGTFLDPLLVGNFRRILGADPPQASMKGLRARTLP